jgi:DNA repair protein RecO (recombination protein O)
MPTGDALLSGYYLNELLLRLLARDDPHSALFDVYAATIQILATEGPDLRQGALRVFELMLLREIGLLPSLDQQTLAMTALKPEGQYCLVAEGGLRQAHAEDRTCLTGAQWTQLQMALDNDSAYTATLRVCLDHVAALRPQLRALLNYHCGVGHLKTRQMMMDIQSL